MSQSDSFIEEVTEEVRRDKLFATFKKYGWIAILLVIVIVAGASWYEYKRAQDEAQAEAFGDAVLAALEQGTPAERSAALDAIAVPTAEGQAMIDLLKAAELGTQKDDEGAIALLTGVAGNSELPVVYRSLAKFRLLALQAGTLSPAERRGGYDDLAGPGSPFRLLAMEQIAVTYAEEGNRDEALSRLQAMLDEAGMTPDLLRRVSQLIVSLGGTPGESAAE